MLYIFSIAIIVVVLLMILSRRTRRATPLFDFRELTVLVFSLLLIMGLAGTFLSVKNISGKENRNLAQWIPLSKTKINRIPQQIENYINDHFGFREEYLVVYQRIQNILFRQTLSNKVTKGSNNWLFLSQAVDFVYSAPVLTKETLANTGIALQLKKMEEYLNKQGIKLFLIVAPSKPNVYPEYLPSWINTTNGRKTISNFEELIRSETTIPVLDLYNCLIDAKKQERNALYYPNDTHWNTVGSHYALKEIDQFLQKNGIITNPVDYADYTAKTVLHYGDLSVMQGSKDTLDCVEYFFNQNNIQQQIALTADAQKAIKFGKEAEGFQLKVTYASSQNRSESVPFILGDSYFISGLVPFQQLFNKYYTAHFMETAVGLPFILNQDKKVNTVILSFVDRQLMLFIESLNKWAPSKEVNYGGTCWQKELPY